MTNATITMAINASTWTIDTTEGLAHLHGTTQDGMIFIIISRDRNILPWNIGINEVLSLL